jgi:cytochrome c oxidase subunit 2
MLAPHGSGAQRIDSLWWFMFWIAATVFGVVMAILIAAIVRRRRTRAQDPSKTGGETFVVVAGIIVPFLILTGLFIYVLHVMRADAASVRDARMTIDVVGHDWWWEVRYPEQGAVTANEIHIPVGEEVRLQLTTDDVIHSFWVPQLNAKTDLIPGKTNYMSLEADRPGTYRGQCAEFCGLEHARMAFYVVADPPDVFQSWVANQAQPEALPVGSQARLGQRIFLNQTCVGCHTIRGTAANGDEGPDLTHFATRATLAAGTLPNTRGNLGGWVADPQGVKPGVKMPPSNLEPRELQAVLTYLEGLR